MMEREVKIILCIPGQWSDRSDIVLSLTKENISNYLFAGNILLHLPSKETFEIEICEPDERLKESFEVAGQGRLSEAELNAIDQHSFVVYITGKGGNQGDAEKNYGSRNGFFKGRWPWHKGRNFWQGI